MRIFLLVSLLLVGSLCINIRSQNPKPIRELGDGFQSKQFENEQGQFTLLHFPDRCFEKPEAFVECAKNSVALQFSSEKSKIELILDDKKGFIIKSSNPADDYKVGPLRVSAEDPTIVGIVVLKLFHKEQFKSQVKV